ncbi:MAG: PEP-CTERM sorting domain-containing protein [Phycisphaerales bacterium]|nr:PEP-CTERM sorting domain-containing protein [Phycisphaerales bacterium]
MDLSFTGSGGGAGGVLMLEFDPAVSQITTASGLTNGLFIRDRGPAYITIGKTDWATKDSTNIVIPLADSTVLANQYTQDFGATKNVDVTRNLLADTGEQVNSLRFNDSGQTLTLTDTLTLNRGGILVTPGTTATIDGDAGMRIIGVSFPVRSDLLIINHGELLTINVELFAPSGSEYSAITIAGSPESKTLLNVAPNYRTNTNGALHINNTILQLGPDVDPTWTGVNLRFNDGTLDINGNNRTLGTGTGTSSLYLTTGTITNSSTTSALLTLGNVRPDNGGGSSQGSFGYDSKFAGNMDINWTQLESTAFLGDFVNTGNLTITAGTTGSITVRGLTDTGSITNNSGNAVTFWQVGPNTKTITQDSAVSSITIGQGAANATTAMDVTGGKTLITTANSVARSITVNGPVIGTGNLTLQNNSDTNAGITFTNTAVGINMKGAIVNEGSGSGTVTIPGLIAGTTAVTQNSNSSVMNLSNANNTYTGPTTVKAGTLTLTANGAINNSSKIIVDAGAKFDVSARNVTGGIVFTVPETQTLGGLGTVIGHAAAGNTVRVNGTLAPGMGTLTFANNTGDPGTGNLSMGENANLSYIFNDTTCSLVSTGTLSFLGNVTLNTASGYTFVTDVDYTLFTYDISRTGTFTTTTESSPGTIQLGNTFSRLKNAEYTIIDDGNGSIILHFTDFEIADGKTYGNTNNLNFFGSVQTSNANASGNFFYAGDTVNSIDFTPEGDPLSGAALIGTTATAWADETFEVSMAWRTRTNDEVLNEFYPAGTNFQDGQGLFSDVVRVAGLEDTFILEMTFDSSLAFGLSITPQLAWLNESNLWESVCVGESMGDLTEFLLALAADGGDISSLDVGTWGWSGNKVWAVVDRNGDYAVIPEPASLALLGLGAIGLLARRRK